MESGEGIVGPAGDSGPARRIVARLALAGFALFLLVAGADTLRLSAKALRDAALALDDTAAARRAEAFGAPYVEAIDSIRSAVPRDGAYLLLTTAPDAPGRRASEEARIWVRYDLAPRRALDLGSLEDHLAATGDRTAGAGAGRPELRDRAGRARWVVVVPPPPAPPFLLRRADLQRRLEEGSGAARPDGGGSGFGGAR